MKNKYKGASLITAFLGVGSFISSAGLEATAIQYFFGINYENPAELQRVKNNEIDIGVDYINSGLKFKGSTVSEGSGTAKSHRSLYMPYLQYAYRNNERVVLAVSITNPELANLNWGTNSIVRHTSTKTFVYQTKIGPRISCQCTENLAVGVGLDVNFGWIGDQLNFFVDGFGNVKNKFRYVFIGYNVGLLYTINPCTFFSAAYYSGKNAKAHGYSQAENGAKNNHFKINPPTPWFVYAKFIRNFNEKFSGYFRVIYSGFSISKQLDLRNTVIGDLVFPTHWKNTWAFEVDGKYAINENWELLGILEYDTNFARRKFNSVAYPGSNVGVAGVGIAHKICEGLRGSLAYGHSIFIPNAKIDQAGTGDKGRVRLNGNHVALRFVIEW